ncbi:MAG: alpha-hydroxy-acid oxidizing enzyme [Muricauda sp.]|nr:alpha-hydroxy acid oxidase [Allomuricauda sp.]MAU26555.1 alpha-hydroxy-acid oxidizing enzyme [Allomuricauda sp.]MBC29935.1 alpha-hydroxy-acid oxidizing enzyme [Allomuricauda sp.]|tara:strand:- start:56859 stop:58025 length:1167 start_codon:yes stop_codon:yes gene_type:complete
MAYKKQLERFANRHPRIEDLAQKAKKRVPRVAWEYLDSGTGDEALLQQNRTAFQNIRFLPRFCKGPIEANTEITLFGKTYKAPIGMAPIGLTGLLWPKAEQYLAATAKRLQLPYCLSTVATETPETIGPLVGDMGWFQLYPPKDRAVRDSLLQRAKDAGFHTLVVTADVPMASRRERSKRAGLAIPPKITPKLIWQGLTHPVWSYHTLRRGLPRLRTVEHYVNNSDMKFVSGFVGNRLGGTLDWHYCKELKEAWGGPVVIKGILHPQDAQKCIDIGMDGIYVSNHGARQFNGAIAAIEALPAIVDQVNGRVPILFDSGVRSGLDVMRALYLGADFVLVGRPFIWGVAALGQYGGDHVANILMDALQNNMVQLGATNFEQLRAADRAGV